MKKEIRLKSLVRKYTEDNCSKEELQTVLSIFEDPYHNLVLRPTLYEIWENTPENLGVDKENYELEPILDKIHHQINLYGDNHFEEKGFKRYITAFTRVAAILFIPLLLASIWYYIGSRSAYQKKDSWISITSPPGSRIKTTLPDGSIVWQNAGTTIKYPRNYTRENRKVILIGEAYFDVQRDPLFPFYVKSENISIKVTGTNFNVTNYPGDNYTSVVLEEGKVNIATNRDNKYKFALSPGEKFLYTETKNEHSISQVDTRKYTAWKDGRLVFRDDPLSVVCKQMERWYNTNIELADSSKEFMSLPFTMTIETENIKQVFDYLCQAAPLEYKVEYHLKEEGSDLLKPKYFIYKRK